MTPQRDSTAERSVDITEFNHHDTAYAADPEPFWTALRGSPTVPRSEQNGGYYVLARHDQICEAARQPELFGSAQGTAIPPFPFPPLIPVEVDPPKHHSYRKILNPYLTPQMVAKKADELTAFADSLLDDFMAKAEGGAAVDFVETFAVQFPQLVALRMIGFPDADRESLGKAIYDLTHMRGIDDNRAAEAAMEVMQRITLFIDERRAAPREDDFVSVLLDAEVDGAPMDDEELLFYLFLLLFGGLDTTTAAIAGTFSYLGQHPEARAALLADEELRKTAVDEFVRWTTPVQGLGRTLNQDVEFHGCPMKAGDKTLLLWAAGNRDATAFDNPDELQLDRYPNHHLGFGMGPHRCMGSHLARLMLEISIERGLERLGEFHVVEPEKLEWVGGEAYQLKALPLKLGPAPA